LADDVTPRFATISIEMDTDLEKITPPKHFSPAQKSLVFQHFYSKLARYRNTLLMYAVMECSMSEDAVHKAIARQRNEEKDIKDWAQALLAKAWIVCFDKEEERTSYSNLTA
jgi:hypothetical protein